MINNKHNTIGLITIIIALMTVSACSKQNWYQGARSAQTAQCLKEPDSEFDDCNQQSDETYESYKDKRDQLIEENKSN